MKKKGPTDTHTDKTGQTWSLQRGRQHTHRPTWIWRRRRRRLTRGFVKRAAERCGSVGGCCQRQHAAQQQNLNGFITRRKLRGPDRVSG
jgi:hypothetical protein